MPKTEKEIKQNPMRVRVGIVAESLTDIVVYQKICKAISFPLVANVIFPENCSYNMDKDGKKVRGGIKVEELEDIKKFYDGESCKKLHLVVIFTDHDNGKAENINELRRTVSSLGFKQQVLVAEPVENLEGWMLQDQATSNAIFGPKSKIFSEKDLVNAKEIFNNQAGQVRLDPVQARRKFAEQIEVSRIKHDDFLEFKNDFMRIVREVISPKPPLRKAGKRKKAKKNNSLRPTVIQGGAIISHLINIEKKIDKILQCVNRNSEPRA